MATVRKTITLTDQQDDWIKAQVEGEKSGKPKRFDAGAFKRKLRRAHGWVRALPSRRERLHPLEHSAAENSLKIRLRWDF
jgi:hypothetical protein